ncbi:MAG: hypothetical protein V3U31_02800 [Dehalococcoidia bacterium]
MQDDIREFFKRTLNMTEEDLAKVPRGMDKTLSRTAGWHIVAQVTHAVYCLAGLKTGDRYVFRALPTSVIPEESGPLCLRALGPLMTPVNAMLDRLVIGRDPNKGLFLDAHCYDPGLEHGGLGEVHFRLFAEKREEP